MIQLNCPHCKSLVRVVIGLAAVIFITCEICGHRYEVKIDPHIHQDDITPQYTRTHDSMFTATSSGIPYLPSYRNLPDGFWK